MAKATTGRAKRLGTVAAKRAVAAKKAKKPAKKAAKNKTAKKKAAKRR